MKHPLLCLSAAILLGILAGGCDDPSKPEKTRVTVNYEIDRQFEWNPAEKRLTGTILIKTGAIAREMPLSANTYGITFNLCPGERTTIIIKSDDDGIYYNGEFSELPMQLPLLMSRQPSGEFTDFFDYDVRAAAELELSAEPIDNRYYLVFSCYDVQSGWFFSTGVDVPVNAPVKDAKFVSLSAGTQEFERER